MLVIYCLLMAFIAIQAYGNYWLFSRSGVVLELLGRNGEMTGMQLVKASNGRLHRGSVYVLLGHLEQVGHVRSREECDDDAVELHRRYYRLARDYQ